MKTFNYGQKLVNKSVNLYTRRNFSNPNKWIFKQSFNWAKRISAFKGLVCHWSVSI